jgi:predicted cupin superfamily sugar epimerase
MSSTRAADLVRKLALQPHPEGGWYREIYRSPTRVETARGSRSALTTIYYLLEQNQLSRWHVVQADELWHFYAGSPLDLLAYTPSTRKFERSVLGCVDAVEPVETVQGVGATGAGEAGATSVSVIPTGVWQAARSLGEYSLVGCTVGPGFEFADFQFVSALTAHADHFKGDLAPFGNLL